MNQDMAIHFDPKLVEKAVFHAQRDGHVSSELEARRNRIYEVADADERERLFHELYRNWFERLGLGKIFAKALQEQPPIQTFVADCYIVCAAQAKQEGAELFVAAARAAAEKPRRTLRILIRPESLLAPDTTLTFLRHELFHIADMLDPAFAYQPTLPKTEGGPTYDTLITNRYRVLWDITIDGRMARRGWLPESACDSELRDFRQAFPMLEEPTEEYFARFFDAAEPKHGELAAFAFDPRAAVGQLKNQTSAGTHCALCKFPTHAFEPAPENLGADLLAAIVKDFSQWTPAQGLCAQCAELYRGRQMSMAALRLLPGYNSCSEQK